MTVVEEGGVTGGSGHLSDVVYMYCIIISLMHFILTHPLLTLAGGHFRELLVCLG